MAGSAQQDPAGKVSKSVLQACLRNANVSFRSSYSRARLAELIEDYGLNPLAVHSLPLLALPSDIIGLVASSLAKTGPDGSKALIRLGSACKELHSIVHGSDDIWRAAWDAFASSVPPQSLEGVSDQRTTCKQRMLLLATTGCQLCNKHPKAKKITWAFGVRTCAGCWNASLISQSWAIRHYELPRDELEEMTRLNKSCHKEDEQIWAWYLHYLWKPDLLPLLTKVHGVASWEEFEVMRRERRQAAWLGRQQTREAQAQERAEQRAQHIENYRQKLQADKANKKKRKREQSARKEAKRQRLQAAELKSLEIDMHF